MNIKAAGNTKTRFLSPYGLKRIGDSMLKSTQPDLIDPVRYLTWLDADRVVPGMLQNNGNGTIRITCPAIDPDRMNIQPIPQTDTLGSSPDLIVHLCPN
jgi:hypothetical protein